jgi:pyrroline-5-carboxylate reductase
MFTDKTIAIVGAGNMGEILIRGLLAGQVITADRIIAVEIIDERRKLVAERHGCRVTGAVAEAGAADIIILAVKPQAIDDTLASMREFMRDTQLVISIAAGIHTERIEAAFIPDSIPVVRVMPNAPASVLEGASALFAGRYASENDLALARGIFEAVGRVAVVQQEWLMDVVTGLSGSGPAFVFMMIEALSDAGVQLGLPRKTANILAGQTVYGAGKLFLESGKHAGELKDLVATPGGTTFAGLRALEKGIFRSTVMDAVEAATKRSKDLGKTDPDK